jgi:putative two-component system response regulator
MLADQYDALRSPRSYKPPYDHESTFNILTHGDHMTRPEHFDPDILQAFRATADEFSRIYDKGCGLAKNGNLP